MSEVVSISDAPEPAAPPSPPTFPVEVRNRWTGEVQFTAQLEASAADLLPRFKLGLAIRWARMSGADLRDADLRDADLRDADLRDADLRGADLRGAPLIAGGVRSDGHQFVGLVQDGVLRIQAGCRNFTLAQAREHWRITRGGTPLGEETFALLDHLERVARIRGLLPVEAPSQVEAA